MNETLNLMKSHRSIRKFKDTPVSNDTLRTILETAQHGATSHFIQAYSVIHVTNPDHRKQIAQLSGPQVWVERSPVFLVFCADLNRLVMAGKIHDKTPQIGYMEQFITATVDTAIFGQNTLLAAESLGLGGVFIGGIRNDPQKICDLLGIPDQTYPVFGMCLGYPDQDPEVKPRLPLDAVLMTDQYCLDGFTDAIRDYDARIRAYYRNRSTNTRDDTWSVAMADFICKIIRPHMKAFVESKGFCLK